MDRAEDLTQFARQQYLNFSLGAILAAMVFVVVMLLLGSAPLALVIAAAAGAAGIIAVQRWQTRVNKTDPDGEQVYSLGKRMMGATALGVLVVLVPLAIATIGR